MRRNRAAFTLIELLVVVAIIVALIAILLPSLSKARENARSVVCLSNVRQIGMTLSVYTTEWGNQLFPVNASLNNSLHWYDMVAGLLTGQKPYYDIMKYAAKRCPAMQCPTDLQMYPKQDVPFTYTMNSRTGAGNFDQGLRMSRVENPSRVVALADAVWDINVLAGTAWQASVWYSSSDLGYYHGSTQMDTAASGSYGEVINGNGLTNGVFLDWHAEPIKLNWFANGRITASPF